MHNVKEILAELPPNTLPIDLPNDDRIQHRYALLNGTKYHYLYAEPKTGSYQYTVFLVSLIVIVLLKYSIRAVASSQG